MVVIWTLFYPHNCSLIDFKTIWNLVWVIIWRQVFEWYGAMIALQAEPRLEETAKEPD